MREGVRQSETESERKRESERERERERGTEEEKKKSRRKRKECYKVRLRYVINRKRETSYAIQPTDSVLSKHAERNSFPKKLQPCNSAQPMR